MEPLPVISNYMTTSGGSKITNTSALYGLHNITGNKYIVTEGTVIRADLAPIKIGVYSVVMPGAVVRPPVSLTTSTTYLPVLIGDYVHIGEGSVVQANDIGNYVHIGNNCVIGPRCKLKDACRIADNTVLPPDTTVPSYTLFGGNPGRYLEDLHEPIDYSTREKLTQYYNNFTNQFF